LFVGPGLNSILLIDVLTYLVAIATLLVVRFPQPPASRESQADKGSLWSEAAFGWKYIRQRPGLLGLLSVFAVVNFLVTLTFPLLTPMLLDMTSPDVVGYVASIAGVGMLVGTLLMSLWGGPKRRIYGILVAEVLIGFFLLLHGLRPSIPLIAIAGFGFLLVGPISNGCSQAIWQTKVAPDVQGRVFSIRRMIAFSVIPLAYILAGPLSERVFGPAMLTGGTLTSTFGPLVGVGPGRGIGLMFVLAGALYMLVAAIIFFHPRIRLVESELPDVVRESTAEETKSA
jgi:hypothetical protein